MLKNYSFIFIFKLLFKYLIYKIQIIDILL